MTIRRLEEFRENVSQGDKFIGYEVPLDVGDDNRYRLIDEFKAICQLKGEAWRCRTGGMKARLERLRSIG